MFFNTGLRGFAGHGDFIFRRGLLKTVVHVLSLRFEFLFTMRARLAFHDHQIGNDVGGHAAFDLSDVGSCLGIDAAELHCGDTFGGNLDGRDSFFWRHAGVRFQAVHLEFDVIGRRTFSKQKARIV